MPSRAGRGAAAALSATLLVTGPAAFGAAAPTTTPTPTSTPTSPLCGTLVLPTNVGFGEPDAFATLQPALLTGSTAEQTASDLLFRPLIWIGNDGRIDWTRSLAERVDTADNGRRFTVTLRATRWSDGVPVDANDVLYAWSEIRALGHRYTNYAVGGVPDLIASVSAPDARTTVFILRRPVNPEWFEQLGLVDFTPLPRHVWSRFTLDEQEARQSEPSFYRVVDGPFRLDRLVLGREAVFSVNPSYDGPHAVFGRLVMPFLQGSDPLEALRTGAIDAAFLPVQLMRAASRIPGIRLVPLGPRGGIATIELNLRNPRRRFLADVAVRQAIARAIDQTRIIRTVYDGAALPQEGFVPTADADALPPELRGGAGPLGHDPAAARALLDRAGYRPGPDGVREGHGERLDFTVLLTAGAADRIETMELAQADLARVGIRMTIKEVEFNQLGARVIGPPDGWDAVFVTWSGGGYPDGSQWFASDSTSNRGGYRDPTMDRLLDAADTRAGNGPLWALERYVVQQQPMIFLPKENPTVLVRDDLGGVGALVGPLGELSPELLRRTGACDAPRA